MSIPKDMTDHEIEKHYTFTSEDISFINKHRRDYNRLGIAVQLAVLRYPGWSLSQMIEVSNNAISYIAKQIGVSPEEYSKYAKRVATRNEHLEELRQHYGFKTCLYESIVKLRSIHLNKRLKMEIQITLFVRLFKSYRDEE